MSRAGRLLVAVIGASCLAAGTGVAVADRDQFRAQPIEPSQVLDAVRSPAGLVSVIVKLDADPIATYRGGIPGLSATSPQVTRSRIRRGEPAVQAYEQFLAGKERAFGAALARFVPRARIVHRFRTIFGGVSVVLPRERVKDLRTLPGVKAVYPDVILPVDTDRSPEFIGAPALWAKVGGQRRAGQGIVVGVVDTGIWPESPSVRDDGTFPPPPAKWTGTACQFGSGTPGDAPFTCDHKLIGARRVMDTFDTFGPPAGAGEFKTARDNNGHGSHTATTAAGNGNVAAEFNGIPLGVLSGVAPRAHLAAYKVCFTVMTGSNAGGGSCYTSDSQAAIEQAILDGVDVINFSIGGGDSPYSDPVSLAFLDAYEAGVFVACSAGNAGPAADSVGHREPWTTTAAATTTDKLYYGAASLSADGGVSLDVTGVSSYSGVLPAAPIVLSSAAPYSDDLCLGPAAPGSLAGKVVACKRGTNARVAKSANVAAGGAVGMILYNPLANQSLNADIHSVPTVHIDSDQGAALTAFLGAQSGPQASIMGMRLLTGQGDVLASFSSRGGPNQDLGISKPDVGAPGVDILAGYSGKLAVPVGPDGQIFNILSGTSMASPHVAGAAALLKQLHPSWGPGEIKSALMMTATDTVTVETEDGVAPATPFDVGSGRIDLTRAGDAGLLISDTAQHFRDRQNNLWMANYPSLYVPVMPGKVAVPRQLVNALKRGSDWTTSVEAPPDVRIEVPRHIEFHRTAEAREIWILVDASAVPLGEVRHARVLFKPQSWEHHWGGGDCDGRHWNRHDCGEQRPGVLSFPITIVRKQGGITLVKACDPTTLSLGDATQCTIEVTNTTFQKANVLVTDWMPRQLRLGSVTGARRLGPFGLFFRGALEGAVPPGVTVAPGSSPEGGYLPLSAFGVTPIADMGDETIANFPVPSFTFAGQSYTQLGVVSNGYVVVGGGTSADVTFVNQNLPDPAAPNNVLAPFWTDLDVSRLGGAVRIATLSDGANTWIVVDWDKVRVYTASDTTPNSFEVWIRIGGTEDITYVYGGTGSGDGGHLTVGAENIFGNSGQSYYYNGTGTLPTTATQLVVTGTPGAPGGTHTITFDAVAKHRGPWVNCADLVTDAVFGITTSCVPGEVGKR
jgi:subtilisin family serine protease